MTSIPHDRRILAGVNEVIPNEIFIGCTSDSLIGLAPPKKTIDASEVKARSEKAKGALDALFASIARLD